MVSFVSLQTSTICFVSLNNIYLNVSDMIFTEEEVNKYIIKQLRKNVSWRYIKKTWRSLHCIFLCHWFRCTYYATSLFSKRSIAGIHTGYKSLEWWTPKGYIEIQRVTNPSYRFLNHIKPDNKFFDAIEERETHDSLSLSFTFIQHYPLLILWIIETSSHDICSLIVIHSTYVNGVRVIWGFILESGALYQCVHINCFFL